MQQYDETERRFVPFLLAFLVTLFLMAGTLSAAIIWHTSTAVAADVTEAPAPTTVFLPRREERLVMLLVGGEDSNTPPDVFLLAGFLPDKGKIALCLLPPKTMVGDSNQWGTLEELFARGGVAYTAKVLGGYLGVTIQRSGVMEVAGLSKLMDTTGSYEYFLPVALDYPLHQRQVTMSRGLQQLNGRRVADLLFYPAYSGGEAERSDRGAMLLTQLVNQNLPNCTTPQGDALVEVFLNHCTTDLSFKDYEERRSATRFLAALKLPAATAVYVEGALNRDYTSFLLTESCRARLTSVFEGEGFAVTEHSNAPSTRLGAWETVPEPKPTD